VWQLAVRTQILHESCGDSGGAERQGRRGRHELAQNAAVPGAALTPWLLCALFGLGFALFAGYSWSGYRARYAESSTGFQVGATRLVELTVIREDGQNLACASDVVLGDIRCGYTASQQPVEPASEPRTLRPYNTVGNELLLGAGLWSSKALPAELPAERFTVTCNYRVTGVLKAASLRWSTTGKFEPLKQSLVAGVLEGCAIPR
jgi:hypothetical protein